MYAIGLVLARKNDLIFLSPDCGKVQVGQVSLPSQMLLLPLHSTVSASCVWQVFLHRTWASGKPGVKHLWCTACLGILPFAEKQV